MKNINKNKDKIMSKTIGIDLGTTNSCVSVIEGGNPIVIANSEGKRTTPSIVAFLDNGERKIGEPAKRQAVTNSKNTISSIKRLMGNKFEDIDLSEFSYEIVKNGENPGVKIGDKIYTPQEISAMILQKMKSTAEDYLGEKVTSAVITVPAFYNDTQRQSVIDAGKIAGLKVERIINEPTAASLAYGLDKQEKDQTVAVFDFGGGTFDISILELGDGVFEVKSTNGDTNLGGDNIDLNLIDYLANEFEKEFGVDLRKDPMALQRLKEASEKAKIELSTSTSSEINLPYIIPIDGIPKHLVKTITRSDFERINDELIDKLKEPCIKALKDANMTKDDIDEIILVGGSTRIPAVQKLVQDIFGKEPSKSVNPDEAVSVGAAIQAGVLSGDVDDVLLLDVTPLSLGIETMGGVMTKLIESNTTIPTGKKQTFSTAADNQPSVEIHILQGERPMARDNKTLGRFHLDSIPPAPRGVPQIEVSFDIDANGVLKVSAKDVGTGKEQQITIDSGSSLSDAEIEQMKKDAEENAEKDAKEKEKIDTLNNADGLIFSTEKQIKDFGEKLQDDDKEKLSKKVEDLKRFKKEEDLEMIKESSEELTTLWNEISTKLYQQGQQSTNENKTESNTKDAEDIGYEEVG